LHKDILKTEKDSFFSSDNWKQPVTKLQFFCMYVQCDFRF
jgi:hypothetical protein